MRVSEMMSVHLVTTAPTRTVAEVARLMVDAGVGSALVVEGGRLKGIFTERDIMRLAAERRQLDVEVVADHMTHAFLAVPPDAEAADVAELMRDRRVRHMPVVEGDIPVGMVSLRDFFVMAGEILRSRGADAAGEMLARPPRADPILPRWARLLTAAPTRMTAAPSATCSSAPWRISSRASDGAWPAATIPTTSGGSAARSSSTWRAQRTAGGWPSATARSWATRARWHAAGVRQLSEFFVLPEVQRGGVGRALLERTFAPGDGAAARIVVATLSPGAQARYLRAGVRPLCPVYGLTLEPRAVEVESDLAVAPCLDVGRVLEATAAVDAAVLGYARAADHGYLALQRTPLLALRGGEVAGYGYVGERCGPFAALDPADLPALLATAESEAARKGLPLASRSPAHATPPSITSSSADAPSTSSSPSSWPTRRWGLDRYVLTAPPFFL